MVLYHIKLQISHRDYWLVLRIGLLNTAREVVVENFALVKVKHHFSQLVIVLELEDLVVVAITDLVRANPLQQVPELVWRFLKSYREAGPDLSRILLLVYYACEKLPSLLLNNLYILVKHFENETKVILGVRHYA